MQSDTLFDSLTRSLALAPEAVYDDRAQGFLPVLKEPRRRPSGRACGNASTGLRPVPMDEPKRPVIAPGAYANNSGVFPAYVTIDRAGDRTAYSDGRVRSGGAGPRQVEAMIKAFDFAPLSEGYLANVVYQPLSIVGLAIRVQQAFGLEHLYTKTADGDLIFLADPSIPSRLVRHALQTVALDRVVAEAIYNESALAATRHGKGDPVCRELKAVAQGPAKQVRAAYLAILRSVLETPAYRDLVGAELPELF